MREWSSRGLDVSRKINTLEETDVKSAGYTEVKERKTEMRNM